MGTVYEAIDSETGERVALKLLRSSGLDAIARFKREFRSLQDIHHPNLVTLGELVAEESGLFFTMELVHGEDFVSWVSCVSDPTGVAFAPVPPLATSATSPSGFPFDERRLRAGLAQLAQGLSALHDAHKVHRDVKPSNVLVEPSGRVVVLDFGLVTDVQETGRSMTELEVVGTPAYMAPEQAASRTVGPAADWYAVGVLLFEAMTGDVPFNGAPLEVLLRKQRDEPPAPSALVPGLPPDLDRLCARLLRFDPTARAGGRDILAALAGNGRSGATAQVPGQSALTVGSPATASLGVPFVGREEQLDALRRAYDHVRATRRGATVVVRGESGIGKSCLVRHFAESSAAHDKEVLLFSGRCYEREAVPYKALDGVVDEIVRFLSRMRAGEVAGFLPSRPAPLVQVFPVFRRVETIAQLRTPEETVADVHELRSRAFDTLRELLVRIGERRPVIVLIDDLQWADEDSLALLRVLLRPPDEPSILLVVTVRDDEANAAPATSRRRRDPEAAIPGDVRRITVERLGRDDARALAARLVERIAPGVGTSIGGRAGSTPALSPYESIGGRAGSTPALSPYDSIGGRAGSTPVSIDALAAEGDGHPLFIDEIVRHLFAVGASRGALKLEDALWARIASLEETPRRIVELCAIAEAPLPQHTVARGVEASPSDFTRLVSFLRVAHLVRTTGPRGSDVIECFHGRIREAVLEHLTVQERKDRYLRLAVALESAPDADADLLAILWLGAGDVIKGAKHMLAAANRAAAALAFDRAARLYERTLELREHGALQGTGLTSRADQRALETKLGDALSNAGRGAKAARAYRAAAAGANAAEGLDLRRRAADQLLRSGHFDEGLAAIVDVLASIGLRLPSTPFRALLALVFWRLVIALRGLRYELVDASHVSARELTRIDACYAIASSLSLIDPLCGNLFHARNLLATMRTGEPRRVSRALAIEVSYRGTAGGPGWARTSALDKEARRVAKELGDPFGTAWATATSAVAHYLSGHFEDALTLCKEAEHTFVEQCAGTTWETFSMRLFTIQSLAHLGRLAELRQHQESALRWAVERGDLYAAVNLRIGYPNLVWLVAGEPETARREATDAMRQWSSRGFHLEHYFELLALSNADLYEGKARDAFARVAASRRPMRRSLLTRVQLVRLSARGLHARAAIAAAEVATDRASRAELLTLAEAEAKAIEREGMVWSAPSASLIRAAATHLRGEAASANVVALLERAVREADAAKLALVGAGARYVLGKSKGGDEGASLVSGALETLAHEGARSPERLIAMVAPGFASPASPASRSRPQFRA